MNALQASILLLGLADKALELRLRQYDANPDLVAIDAENAEELAKIGNAVLRALNRVGDAIEEGFDDLMDPETFRNLTAATKPKPKPAK